MTELRKAVATSKIEIESAIIQGWGSIAIKVETELAKKFHSKKKKRREDVDYKIHFISL